MHRAVLEFDPARTVWSAAFLNYIWGMFSAVTTTKTIITTLLKLSPSSNISNISV